jgi:tRNA threonylcarbamoyladenosine biosynthesis protein TsaE
MTADDAASRNSTQGRAAERVTHSEAETAAVATELAATVQPGNVILLSGDLGAGKTAFVRGLAVGLGIDPDEVSSPTFTLIHEYRGGRLTLYHADLYRLERAAAEDLGLEEVGVSDGVLAIEWPERLAHDIDRAIGVNIEITDEHTRRVRVSRV